MAVTGRLGLVAGEVWFCPIYHGTCLTLALPPRDRWNVELGPRCCESGTRRFAFDFTWISDPESRGVDHLKTISAVCDISTCPAQYGHILNA